MNATRSQHNFVLQQGFDVPAPAECPSTSSALQFQPRVVAPVALLGVLLSSSGIFVTLGLVLWWSAALPQWNPFDAIYNATIARRPGATRLTPAPAPRRFSQVLAGAFALGIAAAMISGHLGTARVLQIFLLVAATAVALFRFCLGSFLYHLFRGQVAFAMRTLPWGSGMGG
jgi:hypothetical protein